MRQCFLVRRLLLPFERASSITSPSWQAPLRLSRYSLPAHSPPLQRFFSGSTRACFERISPELEKRINDIPLERFRNFCIVAHVVGFLFVCSLAHLLCLAGGWVQSELIKVLIRFHRIMGRALVCWPDTGI